jgi:hypothetical protein
MPHSRPKQQQRGGTLLVVDQATARVVARCVCEYSIRVFPQPSSRTMQLLRRLDYRLAVPTPPSDLEILWPRKFDRFIRKDDYGIVEHNKHIA